MIFELKVNNTENIANLTDKDIMQINDIMIALIECGGCTGVKSGQSIIHFDSEGMFNKVELRYSPWKRR